MTHLRSLATLLIGSWLLLLGCRSSEPAPVQSPEQLIADKWWCPTSPLAQQYFGKDGRWQQRLTASEAPDTGTWHFSADKKTIQIRNVKSATQLMTEWEYSVDQLASNSLRLGFLGFTLACQPCP